MCVCVCVWFMHPHTGHFEQVPKLPLSPLLQTHQDLLALGHALDHALHLGQQLHHALAARRGLTASSTNRGQITGGTRREEEEVVNRKCPIPPSMSIDGNLSRYLRSFVSLQTHTLTTGHRRTPPPPPFVSLIFLLQRACLLHVIWELFSTT